MTFEAEWAAARASAAQSSAMRLNQVDGSPGGPANDAAVLAVNSDELGSIGHDAYGLYGRLSKDGDHARPSTFDAAIALMNGNFTSGSELLKVHDRWNTQLRTLLDACAHISNHLDYTKSSHANNDTDIAGNLTSVSKISEYFK